MRGAWNQCWMAWQSASRVAAGPLCLVHASRTALVLGLLAAHASAAGPAPWRCHPDRQPGWSSCMVMPAMSCRWAPACACHHSCLSRCMHATRTALVLGLLAAHALAAGLHPGAVILTGNHAWPCHLHVTCHHPGSPAVHAYMHAMLQPCRSACPYTSQMELRQTSCRADAHGACTHAQRHEHSYDALRCRAWHLREASMRRNRMPPSWAPR